jgi:hypothetical protein
MKSSIFKIFVAIIVIISSCKVKQDPIGYIGNAEFYASGTKNNSSFLFEAGNNNFVMQTVNSIDSLNVKTYTGTIKKNCSNCNEKLSITFRNYEIGNSSNWVADSLFKEFYFYNYFNEILPPSGYKVVFTNKSIGLGKVDYKWDFGGGFGSLSENPVFVFNSDGKKNIQLQADFKDANCKSLISNPIYINPNNLNNYIDYDYTNIGSNVFRCTVKNADSSTHKFVWQYLNQTNSFPKGNTFELPAISIEGVHKVDLLAINKATNDTTIVSKNLATSANTDCSSNFEYSISPIRDTLQLKKVLIEYVNENGSIYSSKNFEQFTGFVIKEIENYKDIVPGKKTIKVKILFSCKLSDGVNIIDLKDIDAVFAFSY